MGVHPRAGQPAQAADLINLASLEQAYESGTPDPRNAAEAVSFGTSGHRGTPFDGTFTRAHILAITQAICDYRSAQGIGGPLMLGMDTHAISAAAQATAMEVLAANGVNVLLQQGGGFTPTPVISHAIVRYNRKKAGPAELADGIVITPSHNPPQDGGFKYNAINGGPADTDITAWVQNRANDMLANGNRDVRRVPLTEAMSAATTQQIDFAADYIADLPAVVDVHAIAASGLTLGVDPLGGASAAYWARIANQHGLQIEVVNPRIDPTFSFMTLDHDGKIRMDCSSPMAMAPLIALAGRYRVACGSDPDADRHGIVCQGVGLMPPNHYLAVAIDYLLGHRPQWTTAAVGKTMVSSRLIDRVVASYGRRLFEVPVGFKWFSPGLTDGSLCFGGEESAGACFLRRDGGVWCTDKDGLILCLLAAEITAVTEKDPGQRLSDLTARFGQPFYTRIDSPATVQQKSRLKALSPSAVAADTLAGDPITHRLTNAPGNGASLGGLWVGSERGWFAARPSGTENVYKVYAESLVSEAHLGDIVAEARQIVLAAVA